VTEDTVEAKLTNFYLGGFSVSLKPLYNRIGGIVTNFAGGELLQLQSSQSCSGCGSSELDLDNESSPNPQVTAGAVNVHQKKEGD